MPITAFLQHLQLLNSVSPEKKMFWDCWHLETRRGRQVWRFTLPLTLKEIIKTEQDWQKPEAQEFLEKMRTHYLRCTYRMDDLQADLILRQLERLNKIDVETFVRRLTGAPWGGYEDVIADSSQAMPTFNDLNLHFFYNVFPKYQLSFGVASSRINIPFDPHVLMELPLGEIPGDFLPGNLPLVCSYVSYLN